MKAKFINEVKPRYMEVEFVRLKGFDHDVKPEFLQFEDYTNWNALRNQAAISVLSATVLREGPDYLTACRHMKEQVSEAIEYADLLIEELKKEKEG